jgi:hypothetical protein
MRRAALVWALVACALGVAAATRLEQKPGADDFVAKLTADLNKIIKGKDAAPAANASANTTSATRVSASSKVRRAAEDEDDDGVLSEEDVKQQAVEDTRSNAKAALKRFETRETQIMRQVANNQDADAVLRAQQAVAQVTISEIRRIATHAVRRMRMLKLQAERYRQRQAADKTSGK